MSLFLSLFQKRGKLPPQPSPLADSISLHNPLEILLKQVSTVCFIGDSITAGSENGGVPWYVPITMRHTSLTCHSLAIGGGTSLSQLKAFQHTPIPADVYVIAIGTNDVRYRDAVRGAINEEIYIDNIRQIVALARACSPSARFVFIAPWCSIPEDPIPPPSMSSIEKELLMNQYTDSLQAYCLQNGFLFINPNPGICVIVNNPILRADYLIDHIHPNGIKGVYLYAAAVYHYAQYS